MTKGNIEEHNLNWSQIPDHAYRILITAGCGSGKTNPLFNLISQQTDSDKIYLHDKNPYETKYKILINKRQGSGLKHFNDSKAFIEYSNDIGHIYDNIEEYYSNKKRKMLIVFDDITADMLRNKKLNPTVTELFIRDRILNISYFLLHNLIYFVVPTNIRLNSTSSMQYGGIRTFLPLGYFWTWRY